MENSTYQLLGEEIERELLNLQKLESGSKEKSTAINDISALYRLNLDQIDRENEAAKLERELEAKSDQKRDKVIGWIFEAANIVVPIAFYSVWMYKGFKFEETGSFTSTTFRGLFNKFRPMKG